MQSKKIYAHRGGAGYHVENTLPAFAFALELEADGAELDVHLTKDGHVVVHHNAKLNHRYTRKENGEWLTKDEELYIKDLTLEELKNYTIGEPNPNTNYHKKFPKLLPVSCVQIPTLQEVIDLVKEKSSTFRLLIEIKTDIFENSIENYIPLIDRVQKIIKEKNFSERAEYCSFDWRTLNYIKSNNEKARLWFKTHPFDWLIDIGKKTLSLPCEQSYLQKLRTAFASGKAYWYGEFYPQSIEDIPKMIKKSNAYVWFSYWRDVSQKTILDTKELKIAGWTKNLNNAEEYNQINKIDLYAQCIDYPNYVFMVPKTIIGETIKLADNLRKEKRWHDAKVLYESIYSDYKDSPPIEIFYRIAIVYRNLRNYTKAESIIKIGLSLVPNDLKLMVELAAIKNRKGQFNEAFFIWCKVIRMSNENISDINIKRVEESILYMDKKNLGVTDFIYVLQTFFNKELFNEYIYFSEMWLSQISKKTKNVHIKLIIKNLLIAYEKNNCIEKYHHLGTILENNYNFLPKDVLSDYLKQNLLSKAIKLADVNKCDYLETNDLVSRFSHILKSFGADEALVYVVKIGNNYGASLYSFYALVYAEFAKYSYLDYGIKLKKKLANIFQKQGLPIENEVLLNIIGSSFFYLEKYDHIESFFKKYDWENLKNAQSIIPIISIAKLASGENPKTVFSKFKSIVFKNATKMHAIQKMNSLISGKSVLIVGPAKSNCSICEDDFDIIIRFNVVSKESIMNKQTDIIYYNKPVYQNFKKEIHKLLESCEVVPIFTTKTATNETIYLGSRLRIGGFRPFLTTNGTLHAVQRALFEVLVFEPKSIKVINTSFFMTDYAENYLSSDEKNLSTYQAVKSVGHSHDPIQSFMFTKILYNAGVVTFDKIGEQVLNMSNKEYINYMIKLNKEGQART